MTDSTAALTIQNLRKTYGPVVAVDGLNLVVQTGECFGLLGPNGAGKTTTIEICEGLTTPDAGEVTVLGEQWAADHGSLRQRLGVSLQETRLSEKLTVTETLRLFRSFYRNGKSVDEVLAIVDLDEKRSSRVGNLSGGQRQRLALACALVGDPELFFLDEPTTGLDPQSRRQVWDLVNEIRRGGRTIVLTTHYMEEAQQLCDRVAIVDHGQVIAQGTPRALIASLGASHVVEFSLANTTASKDHLALLQDIPSLQNLQMVDGTLSATAEPVQDALTALLQRLATHGLNATSIHTHTASLEDVFVARTGRRLRDG